MTSTHEPELRPQDMLFPKELTRQEQQWPRAALTGARSTALLPRGIASLPKAAFCMREYDIWTSPKRYGIMNAAKRSWLPSLLPFAPVTTTDLASLCVEV
jgi:hypothetical protein